MELRERDVRPSLRGALAMLAFMACNAFFQVAFLSSGGELTMLDVFRSDIFATVLLLVGAVVYRRTLLANRRGKSTTAAIFLLVLGMTTSDGLSALVGQTPQAAAPFSLFASGFGFAALTTLLDLRARSRCVAGGCATLLLLQAVCAAQVPDLAVTLLSMSVLEAVLAAGLIVMDMVREGAPPEEAG